MNSEHPFPSDDAIERGLARRAPHGADLDMLEMVMADVRGTHQAPRWWPPTGSIAPRIRRRVTWVAVAAALAVVIAATVLLGGGGGPRPSFKAAVPPTSSPAVVVVSPSSSPEQTASASPVTCATQTTSVLTGNAMPPTTTQPMTVASGVLDVGVYLTAQTAGDPGGQNDVWAIRAGDARRIASIVGPDFNVAEVDDISADGRTVLVKIGVVHGGLPGPMCSDLYAVKTDGSGAIRLTFDGPEEYADDGVFSHDGRYVAFAHDELAAVSPAIGLVDLQGDPSPQIYLCDPSANDLHLAWSPADDRLAAACGPTLMVAAVGGSPARVVGADTYDRPTAAAENIGIGWRDPLRILLTTADPGTLSNGPLKLTTLTLGSRASARDGTWSPTISSHPPLADSGLSTPSRIAPDGHAIALYGDPVQDDPSGDSLALYALEASDGVAQRVASWGATDPGWSSDSKSLVFVDGVSEHPVLTVYDLVAKTRHRYGSMPIEYSRGIWRAP